MNHVTGSSQLRITVQNERTISTKMGEILNLVKFVINFYLFSNILRGFHKYLSYAFIFY